MLNKLKAKKIHGLGSAQDKFDFFMIKLVTLEGKVFSPEDSNGRKDESTDQQKAIQFFDLSEKIFMDNLYTERKYLTYINAMVSHEMRNPLNSINAQISSLS